MTPIRIQRKRTKGWRMPPNTVSVSRPSDWGNPYTVAGYYGAYGAGSGTLAQARQDCVDCFEDDMNDYQRTVVKHHLAGKNLACWCPLDQPCHADVLLKIANSPG